MRTVPCSGTAWTYILPPALSDVILEPAYGGVEGIPERDIRVLVGVISRPGVGHRQLFAGRIDLDPDPEQIALAVMAMLLLDGHPATGDPIGEALELRRLFPDPGLDRG
jgi:hypothetical protein